jgi:hypothetical protein
MRPSLFAVAAAVLAAPLAAAPGVPLPGAALAAQPPAAAKIPPVAEQVAAATLPLTPDMRAGATVMGYRDGTTLVVLREGKNGMHCLALYVTRPDFHVACYHESLEPFMARGRALRAQGVTSGTRVDSIRFAEIKAGKLPMPVQGSLHTITAKKEHFNPATNTVTEAGLLTVLYIPGATAKSIGITETPQPNAPWIMFPGTPKAHVMMAGKM